MSEYKLVFRNQVNRRDAVYVIEKTDDGELVKRWGQWSTYMSSMSQNALSIQLYDNVGLESQLVNNEARLRLKRNYSFVPSESLMPSFSVSTLERYRAQCRPANTPRYTGTRRVPTETPERSAAEIINEIVSVDQDLRRIQTARETLEARAKEKERAAKELAEAQEKARHNTRAGFIEIEI